MYETRPDPIDDRRGGFLVRTGRRGRRIEVWIHADGAEPIKTRTVHLDYAPPTGNAVSLLSREVQSAMTATGTTWNHSLRPDLSEMREAFAALHAAAPKDGVVVTKDVAYGPHPRNILDVYKPAGALPPLRW